MLNAVVILTEHLRQSSLIHWDLLWSCDSALYLRRKKKLLEKTARHSILKSRRKRRFRIHAIACKMFFFSFSFLDYVTCSHENILDDFRTQFETRFVVLGKKGRTLFFRFSPRVDFDFRVKQSFKSLDSEMIPLFRLWGNPKMAFTDIYCYVWHIPFNIFVSWSVFSS